MANLDFLTNDSDSEDDAQVQWASGKCAVQIVWPAVIIALIIPFTISAASHRFDAAEQLHTLRKQQHFVPNQTAHHLLVISHGFQGENTVTTWRPFPWPCAGFCSSFNSR